MKRNQDWREKYQTPEILTVDISAGGILCESYENEEYEDNGTISSDGWF